MFAPWRSHSSLRKYGYPITGKSFICCATSCEFYEKRATKPKFIAQSRPTLYFLQQLSFLQPATNGFVARQVYHARWKLTGNIDENVERNNVAWQVRVFVTRISPPLVTPSKMTAQKQRNESLESIRICIPKKQTNNRTHKQRNKENAVVTPLWTRHNIKVQKSLAVFTEELAITAW